MKNRVITISREFGSGGRTIGRRAAEQLGIPCYDNELIQKIVEHSGFMEDYVREEGEYAPSGWFAATLSSRRMGPTNQDRLWIIQHNIICDLAEKESCVIVGRCAGQAQNYHITLDSGELGIDKCVEIVAGLY